MHQPVGQSHVLLKHLSWVGGGDIVAKAAVLLTTLIAARALTPGEFGRYVGLYALSLFAASLWDFGVSTLMTRELAAGTISARRAARQALGMRLRTAPAWGIATIFGFVLLRHGSSISAIAGVAFGMGSLVFGVQMIALAGLRGGLRFREASTAVVAGRLTTAIVSVLALTATEAVSAMDVLALAFLIGEAFTLALAVLLWRRTTTRTARDTGKLSLRLAAPFAANTVLAMTYNRLDVLIVAGLTSAVAAGAYATASRIQDALYLIPATVGAVALPSIAGSWATGRQEDGSQVALRLAVWGVLLGLAVAAVTFAAAPLAIDILAGDQYAGAVTPIRILAWFLPLAMLQAPLIALLAATNHARETTKIFGVTFAVAMVCHISLDPWAGANGAALASLMRDIVAAPLTVVVALRSGVLHLPKKTVTAAPILGESLHARPGTEAHLDHAKP